MASPRVIRSLVGKRRQQAMRSTVRCGALWIIALVAGCGTDEGPERAAVSGTVKVDGEPLAQGAITFQPTEGTEGPSAGGAVTDGKFDIPRENGVVVGKNRVEITGNRKTGRKVPDAGKPGTMSDELVSAVSVEANRKSNLVKTVTSGTNTFDFDVKGTKSATKAR
jgi:hypothetical protein